MKVIIRISLVILIGFFICQDLSATHNRAGEITYIQIDELTIRTTITTFTKASSTDADRDTLLLNWGDGTSTKVLRSNDQGDLLENDLKRNIYISDHTYPGQGTYTMSVQDPNRVGSILNVNFPNSINVPFYIETTFTFLNPQFQGFNNSAQLLQAPIDFACVGQRFIHNPNAFDIDGDSLAFEIFVPFQDRDFPVPNYQLPDEISPGPENELTIDPETGNVIWDAPQLQGEYNLTIKIKEYREGLLINSITRDMQILVRACDNMPPTITVDQEICIVAGQELILPILVEDSDEGQLVQLSATGGPFTLENSPATLDADLEFQNSPINGIFRWQTNCNHVSDQKYQVVFRAVDNLFGDTGLADLKTVSIKVVAPPPLDIQSRTVNNAVMISWESPYECEVTDNEYFRGFSVWKKTNSFPIPIDTCANGLENTPYQKIIFLTNQQEDGRYFGLDADVNGNNTYCYRVVAEFAKLTNTGNPFNKVASLPSEETCILLNRDLPIITNVSVVTTDINSGEIEIKWIKPLAEDLDTILNPGPYRYELLRGIGENPNSFDPVPNAVFITNSFAQEVDLKYVDTDLNTRQNQYSYRIRFSTNGNNPYGESQKASSVFLNSFGIDKSISLDWSFDVPWTNSEYIVYRLNQVTGLFDSLANTNTPSFLDQGLENDEEYCYLIETIGTFGISGIESPLINFSQESCAIPFDNQAPCIPLLEVVSICDDENLEIEGTDFETEINWTMPNRECPGSADLSGYKIYFSEFDDGEFDLLAQIDDPDETNFIHQRELSIAGCYAVSSIDSLGNESLLSTSICVENCPFYELPNVFTPNGDNIHELFRPSSIRFIDRVEMEIYNRWGQKVFETSDPLINWDGTNQKGKELADGAYYYTCRVFLQSLDNSFEQYDILQGYIHKIGSK